MHHSNKPNQTPQMQNTKDKEKILKTIREEKNAFGVTEVTIRHLSTWHLNSNLRLVRGAGINCQLRISNKNILHKVGQKKGMTVT